MKYITSALVLVALLGSQTEQVNAIKIQSGFTDDLVKSLAQDMAADAEKGDATTDAAEAKPSLAQQKTEKKTEKKAAEPAATNATKKAAPAKKAAAPKSAAKKEVKKTSKKDEDEIPMDAAAIKAYSSVIADAAEDSEPATPVEYHAVITEEEKPKTGQIFSSDPMGSMIQNEISSIKTASIKAAQDKEDE